MRRNLLFVTSQDDVWDDGLSYVLNLARITQKGIAVLMVYKNKLSERLENLITAITFAEANEHETAREILNGPAPDAPGRKLQDIREKCMESGVAANLYTASDDIPSALKRLLKRDRSIDMVLFSPNITGNGSLTMKDLKKLLRTVSMPIVTLTPTTRSYENEAMSHANKSMEVA